MRSFDASSEAENLKDKPMNSELGQVKPVKQIRTPPRRCFAQRILIAVDFSPPSQAALALAKLFSTGKDSELHLAHVVEAEPSLSGLKTISLLLPEKEIRRRVVLRLRDAAVKEALSVRRRNLHPLEGKPHVEICQLAADLAADLIIIGTRGQTGLRHLALGSTAERVVRHAPCRVLVSHSPGKKRPPSSFKKILVPTDFSLCSTAGLETAKALAAVFEAKLFLLHSVDLHYYNTNPDYSSYDYPAVFDAAKSAARAQLEEVVNELTKDGFRVESALEFGHAGAAICQEAEKLGANLIVTSTHGRTGLKHVFLGSTAEYIVRHATSPVLVVPSLVRVGSFSRRRRVK